MKVRLNLSTTPQQNHRPFIAASILIGVVGVIALIVLSRAAYVSWNADREVRAQISSLQAQVRQSTAEQAQLAVYFRSPQARDIMDRANFLNSLIDERSFPWTDIFQALERTLPDGVRVVSISPKLVNGRAELKLTVGAANDQQKVRFLKAMETSGSFSNLEITSERRSTQANDPLDQVVLELEVMYQTT
jgi:Tfp pilus assembly protein PilN